MKKKLYVADEANALRTKELVRRIGNIKWLGHKVWTWQELIAGCPGVTCRVEGSKYNIDNLLKAMSNQRILSPEVYFICG